MIFDDYFGSKDWRNVYYKANENRKRSMSLKMPFIIPDDC